jgi:hypothetical protein
MDKNLMDFRAKAQSLLDTGDYRESDDKDNQDCTNNQAKRSRTESSSSMIQPRSVKFCITSSSSCTSVSQIGTSCSTST